MLFRLNMHKVDILLAYCQFCLGACSLANDRILVKVQLSTCNSRVQPPTVHNIHAVAVPQDLPFSGYLQGYKLSSVYNQRYPEVDDFNLRISDPKLRQRGDSGGLSMGLNPSMASPNLRGLLGRIFAELCHVPDDLTT